jgi:hypothetical protein
MSSTPPPRDDGAANDPRRSDGGTDTPPTSGSHRWDPGAAGSSRPANGDALWQRPEGWRPPEQADVPRRKIGRSVWILAGLALLLVVALVAWRLWPSSEDEVREAAEQFLDAAVTGDCVRAEELSTGEVRDQLGTLCSEQDPSPLAGLSGNADPSVEVDDVDGDQATATGSLSVSSFALQVEMSLLKEDGEWLVSELALPGGLPEELLGSTVP